MGRFSGVGGRAESFRFVVFPLSFVNGKHKRTIGPGALRGLPPAGEYDPRQEGERVSFHERSKRALGRTTRVNVEVASGHYSASAIRAKARAGFVVHATGPSQARVLRALGDGEDHASIRGPAQRDPAAFEL